MLTSLGWSSRYILLIGTPLVLLAGAFPRVVRLTRLEPDEALRRPD